MSWFMGNGEGRSSLLVSSGWWQVIVHGQWAAVVVGSGCEWLVMVVGGGGVVLWSLWLSAFVGCHCLSLWPVVVIPCRSSFVAMRPLFLICEKRRGGGGDMLLTSSLLNPLLVEMSLTAMWRLLFV